MPDASVAETVMIAIGALVLVLLVVIVLRGRTGGGQALRDVTDRLAQAEGALRDAVSRADRAETLSAAREGDVVRLRTEHQDLRERFDAGAGRLTEQLAQIAGYEANLVSERNLVADRDQAVARLMADAAEARQRFDTVKAEEQDLRTRLATLERQGKSDTETLVSLRSAVVERDAEIALQRQRVEDEQRAQQDLHARIAALETRIERDRAAAEEKIALLTRLRDDMQERFRQLADEALKVQGEAFGKSQAEKLEATLMPLKEHVGHFEKELREVHQETVKDRERLKTEILTLTRRSEAISQEALALTRALKGDHQKQGAWGEMILESILERSGLRKDEEYTTQAHRTGTEGERLRPDVIVNIPGGKSLVIDSKVSLNDYAAAVNAEDDITMFASRKRHVAALRSHIIRLSDKAYQLAEGLSVDYVIMFVPIEGALSEALREDGSLTEFALERHITIATPTTLMMALRTVSNVWAVERRNQNAEAIAKRAGLLYDKVAGFVSSMEKVGRGIETARGAYDAALGQLSRGRGNLLSQAEQLRALGARATKPISVDFDGRSEAILLAGTEDDSDASVEQADT